jgi:stage III sporulation protein AC
MSALRASKKAIYTFKNPLLATSQVFLQERSLPYMFNDASILFQIAGIGIIVALIHTILKQMGKEEIAQFATLIGFIIVLVVVINSLSDLFQQIRSVFLFQG